MRVAIGLWGSTVGKKVVMAMTGLVLFGYVVLHLFGNLKIYEGPEIYDAYARFLRVAGSPLFGESQVLWIARAVLLAAVVLHAIAAVQLWSTSAGARRTGYRKFEDLSFSYASRTMRWGGVILAAFVVYHILHLTTGTLHGDFHHDSVYHNVVAGFRRWPVSAAYVLAMLPLGLHIYHGLWSATQTLSARNPWVRRWRRPLSGAVALVIVAGNVSIPLAVLAGWIA